MAQHLTADPLDVGSLVRAVSAPENGAVVLFVGTVRDHHADKEVVGIEYAAYPAMAEQVLGGLEQEIGAERGATVRIVHAVGELEVGEPSVVIAAASAHREGAFGACQATLERLKKEAPIWKRERYADGTWSWREEEELKVLRS